MKVNAVFEGGGMRGIGIVGALTFLERKGYEWERTAGTSVGAVIAALIAAGYTAREMKDIIAKMDFRDFMDKSGVRRLPLVGKALGFILERGIYSGDYVETWMEELLKAKGVTKFKDIMLKGESRLKIVASDITKRKILILPEGLKEYGINPLEFSVARAVRMSTSIPIYFTPVEFIHADGISYIMDGSLCCNYPINIFDTQHPETCPTIGFKFDAPEISNTRVGKKDPLSILCDIADTIAFEKRKEWMKPENIIRTVLIPTTGVKTTEFNLSLQKSIELFRAGYKGAIRFYKNWSYDEYLKCYSTHQEKFQEGAV